MYKRQGQESQQPQESQQQGEVTLQSLMDFMRTQSESLKVIRENLEENRKKEINEKFDQQKEEINQRFDQQNEKFNTLEEKLDHHKEDVKQQMAEQLALIQSEMRDHKTSCDDKIS